MDTPAATREKMSREQVLQTVKDLCGTSQQATREAVANVLGVSQCVADEHLGNLANDGRIRRVKLGIYVPMQIFPPPRAISVRYTLASGLILGLGDNVLELTPCEARLLRRALYSLPDS